MSRLKLEKVSKSFGKGIEAVKDVSISVEEGEFLTLLGPSGCGKTTLLRLIAGLEQPDRGRILIEGQDITEQGPAERDVAMVFQTYALYPHMRVFDNIAVSLRLRKIPRDEIKHRVDKAAGLLGIEELLHRLPKELSGGQRQRVALARSLVREPRLFLLDEPLSNLDALLREKTRSELKLLFSRIKGTVIYVTHDQAEAISMSTRVVVMKDGQVQQTGTPEEIYAHPANRFVAGFVGSPSMSFIEAEIEEGRLNFGEYSIRLKEPLDYSGPVLAGIRPEDIMVKGSQEKAEGSGQEWASASVVLVEPQGSHDLVTLEHKGITLRALARPGSFEIDQAVQLSLPEEKIHLFHPDSGLSITGY